MTHKRFVVRMPQEIHAALVELARVQSRSMNAQVIQILEGYMNLGMDSARGHAVTLPVSHAELQVLRAYRMLSQPARDALALLLAELPMHPPTHEERQ